MKEIAFGLASGATLGLCAAPLWMMLQLPMRVTDIFDCGNMRIAAFALLIGATIGALGISGFLPLIFGVFSMLLGGIFVGMLASALVEAVEVIPVLFDRLSITTDMRYAAAALAIGKGIGALIGGLMGA
ncbi:MAG: stage V sporulation protein AB [Clostridia bacterium]|nr:stage V sporulation protein AB [Clostridia bacterium]